LESQLLQQTLILSNNTANSPEAVAKLVRDIFRLKSKKMPDYEKYLIGLVENIKTNLLSILDEEATQIKSLYQGTPVNTTFKIRVANLKTLISVLIALRNQFDEGILLELVKISLEKLTPTVESLVSVLNDHADEINRDKNIFNDFEFNFMSSFTGFILTNTISFISYGSIWPELHKPLATICKFLALSCNKLVFPKPAVKTPKKGVDEQTFEVSCSDTPCIDSETVFLPPYTKLRVEVEGCDNDFDQVVISTIHEYDRHDIGKSKEVTGELFMPYDNIYSGRPLTLPTNWIRCTVLVQPRPEDNNESRVVKVKVTGEEPAIKCTGKLETLWTISREFVVRQLKKEIEEMEKAKPDDAWSEQTTLAVETLFSSPLFDHGFQSAIFSILPFPSHPDTETSSFCIELYNHLLQTLKIDEETAKSFDSLAEKMQSSLGNRFPHAKILGDTGLVLCKSLFLVLLHHAGSLNTAMKTAKANLQPQPELQRIWAASTKIRLIARQYDSDKQFYELFKKLQFLLAIPPSDRWEQDKIASSPTKEQVLNEGVVKMKLYLEELRVNSRAPDQDDSKVLVEVVQRLLSLQVSTEELIKMLEYKDRHFALFAKALDTVIEMAVQAPENLHEALDMFNFLFRKSNSLDYLMADYSGLPRTQVEKQITVLASLFKIILDFLCAERREGEEERILLSIESLKWLWRGKELPCVQQIDVHKIWGASMARLGLDPRFRLSLVDLCFILLKFCNEKSLQLNEDPDDMPDLSLKRHASVVDESSMAHILNQNFTFLITVLSEALQEFSKFSDVLTLNELEQLTTSRPGDISTNCLYDTILKAQKDDLPLPDSDSYIPQKRPFEVLETKTEEYEEMQEVRADLTEEERVVAEKEDPSGVGGLFDDPEPTAVEKIAVKKTRKIMNKSTKLDDLKQIVAKAEGIFAKGQKNLVRAAEEGGKVLAVFNFYVHSSPDMARLFFSHRENLELISSVAFGQLPEALVIPAVKIWEQLALILPANLLLSEMPAIKIILAPLVERSRAKYLKEKKPSSVTSGVLEAQRQLLSSLATREGWECISDEIAFLLKQDDGCKDLALDLLIPGPKKLIPGSLCFDTTDPVREQLLLLNTLPHLRTKAYLRDLLYYRYDITSDQEVSKNRADRFSIHQDCYLTVCLRTKNYAFIPKSRVSLFPPTVDKELYNKLLNKLDLKGFIETLPNSTSAQIQKFAALSAIKLTSNPHYKPLVNTLLQSITPDRCNVFSEQELSTQLIDFIDFVSNTPGELIQSQATAAPSQIQKFKDLKARLYSNLRSSRAPAGLIEDAYWTSQFGIRGVKTDKINFNIAYNKPSLDLDTAFDHARLECRKGWSQSALHNLINQAIYQTGLLYQFAVRAEEDRLSLVYPLAERLYLLSYRHSDLAEAAEVQIMLEIILEESTKESLLDLANDTMKRDFSEQSYPWELRLLDRLVRRLKNAEMAKQFYLYSIDQVIILTKKRELIERDNRLLNALVETVEKGVETGRLLGTIIEIEGERKAAVEEWFKCIDIPSGDRYSFKRTHKLEYLQNILLHFAFSMVEKSGDPHFAESIPTANTIRRLISTFKSFTTQDFDKKMNEIIRAVIVDKFGSGENAKLLDCFRVELNDYGPCVFMPEMKKYSHWCAVKPTENSHSSVSLCSDHLGTKIVKDFRYILESVNDLGLYGSFQVDKSKDYYLSSHFPDDYLNVLDNSRNFIVHSDNDRYSYCDILGKDYIIVSNKLINVGNYGHVLDEGISVACVSKETVSKAYYKPVTKELIFWNGRDRPSVDAEMRKAWFWEYSMRQCPGNIFFPVSLESFPRVVHLTSFSKHNVAAIDITGGLILIRFEDHEDWSSLKDSFDIERPIILTDKLKSIVYLRHKIPSRKLVYANFSNSGKASQLVFVDSQEKGFFVESRIGSGKKRVSWVKQGYKKAVISTNFLAVLTIEGDIFIVPTESNPIAKDFNLKPHPTMSEDSLRSQGGFLDEVKADDIQPIESTGLLIATTIYGEPEWRPVGNEAKQKFNSLGATYQQGAVCHSTDIRGRLYFFRGIKYNPYANTPDWDLRKETISKDIKEPINVVDSYPICFSLKESENGQVLQRSDGMKIQELELHQSDCSLVVFYPFKYPSGSMGFLKDLKENLIKYQADLKKALSSSATDPGASVYYITTTYRKGQFFLTLSQTCPGLTPDTSSKVQAPLPYCIFKLWLPPTSELLQLTSLTPLDKWPNHPMNDILDLVTEQSGMFPEAFSKFAITLVPDVTKLSDEEFEVFKSEHPEFWKDDIDAMRKEYMRYKDLALNVMGTKMEDERYDRTELAKIFSPKFRIQECQEFNEFFRRSVEKPDDIELFSKVAKTIVIQNYSFLIYSRIRPFYNKTILDEPLLTVIKKDILNVFDVSLMTQTLIDVYAELYLYRMRAKRFASLKRQNFSLLAQLSNHFAFMKEYNGNKDEPSVFELNSYKTQRNFYTDVEFNFRGEAGTDAGGPRREYLSNLSLELTEKLRLFVKSPNSVHNVGEERDKLVPNPKANSKTDYDNFYRLGMIMALCCRFRESLELNFPSIFWVYMLTAKLPETFDSMNINHEVCLTKIQTMSSLEIDALDTKMSTYLMDGQPIDLTPGSGNICLSESNRSEYIVRSRHMQRVVLLKAYKKIREGFYDATFCQAMFSQSPLNLENRVCGMDYVDITVLKSITKYNGFPNKTPGESHESVLWFWEILSEFSQELLADYLRYVWGRSRLGANLSDTHKITFTGKSNIPEAHTCFFELDLGTYPSKEDLKKKLLYGIKNCGEISETSKRFNFSADFGLN
jgi:hypothetical protein